MLFDFLGLYPYYGHKILTWLKVEVGRRFAFRISGLGSGLRGSRFVGSKPIN